MAQGRFPTLDLIKGNAPGAFVAPVPIEGIDFSAGTKALDSIAASFREDARNDVVASDSLKSVDAEMKFQVGLQKWMETADMEAPDFSDQLLSHSKELSAGLVESAGFGMRESSADFQRRVSSYTVNTMSHAFAEKRKALAVRALEMRENVENETLNSIAMDPDNYDSYLAAHAQKAGRVNTGISPSARARMDEDFADNAIKMRAKGLVAAGRDQEAVALIQANPSMDPALTLSLIKRSRTEGKKAAASRGVAATSNLDAVEKLIDSGEISTEAEIRAALKQAAPATRVSPKDDDERTPVTELKSGAGYDYSNPPDAELLARKVETAEEAEARYEDNVQRLLKRAKNVDGKKEKAADDQARLIDGFYKGGGKSWNEPNSQGAVNQLYEDWLIQETRETGEAPQLETQLDVAATFAKRGYIPDIVSDQMKFGSTSADPERVKDAVQTYLTIHASNPDMPLPKMMEGEQALALIKAGLPQHEALVLVSNRSGASIDRDEKEGLRTTFREESKTGTTKDREAFWKIVAEKFKVDPEIVSSDPKFKQSLMSLTEEFYILNGGNADAAVAAASEAMQKRSGYAVSDVGGRRHIARYATESMINAYVPRSRDYDVEVVTDAMNTATRNNLIKQGATPYASVGADKWAVDEQKVPPFVLQADQITKKEIEAGARPSYPVLVRNGYGMLVPVKGKDGNFIRQAILDDEEFRKVPEVKEREEELLSAGAAARAATRAARKAALEGDVLMQKQLSTRGRKPVVGKDILGRPTNVNAMARWERGEAAKGELAKLREEEARGKGP